MSTLRDRPGFALVLCVITLVAGRAMAQDGTEETTGGVAPNSTVPPLTPTTPPPPPPATPVLPAFESPVATLETFIKAMNAESPDYERAMETIDLSEVSEEAGQGLAISLLRCINRIELIDFENDPTLLTKSDLEKPLHRTDTSFTFFPRVKSRYGSEYRQYKRALEAAGELSIVFVKQPSGRWKFSAETVENINELQEQFRDLDAVLEESLTVSERLENLWPEPLVIGGIVGIKYWQWILIFILIIAGLALDHLFRFVLATISLQVIRRRGGSAKRETMRKMVRPFGLAVAAVFWYWSVRLLGLHPDVIGVVTFAVRVFLMLAMVWAAMRLTDLLGEVLLSKAARTDTKFDDLLVPLVRKAVKLFIGIFALIYVADAIPGVSIAPLVAGLGVGGVGFAFAAKDTIENFFGSISVIVDQPFQVGDWVTIGDTEGTVEELGLRSVRIRTFYNSLVTIPTANLVRAAVDNYGRRKYRRWKTHLNLTYDTPPDKIEMFCEGVRELIRVHPYTRKDFYQVWLHQFGTHSLDVLVYVFHETPDWQTELRERQRLMLDILRLADRLGVEFAFPTQTLHMYQEEPGAEHAPADVPAEAAEVRAERAGRAAAHAVTANATWRRGRPKSYQFLTSVQADDEDETQIESKVGGDI